VRRAALAIVVALASASAHAGDGALEINQACAATGCFPGDTAGFPVTTQTGKRYVLTSDLTLAANTSGITAVATTTIDLNGFAITGPVTCTGSPAVCVGAGTGNGVSLGRGAVLRNGTVRGISGSGVSLDELSVVENVLVEQNGTDGIVGSAEGAVVRNCRIADNGSDGIQFALGAGSPAALVLDSVIFRNGEAGVKAAEILVRNNTIMENGDLGLQLNFVSAQGGYVGNVLRDNNGGNANPQTAGGIQLGTNICATDTVCP
jgi:hypothetical protein